MGWCPAIRPKCRRPSLTGDTSERARLGVRASTTALRRGEKMGGCPAIRPKCRRSSQTGDTSERARLEVRASTTALRRRGKDGRTGDTSERARLEVRASTTALRRRGKDGRYGPQRRPCAGGEKMGGCPAIRPKCRRPSLTGDTSERARLEVRASTTALRRRGKDGRVPGD
ncbi:hypothetical protein Bbelb_234830 [Branchiostoma belcheri]|nr:hypothetical protein Bbelb_234830 [Branchiostoma belcheri]